jgi:hypothetical protein
MKVHPRLCLIDANGNHHSALARIPGSLKLAGLLFVVTLFEGIREAYDSGGILSLEMLLPTVKSAAAAAVPVVWAYLSRSGTHTTEISQAQNRIAELEALLKGPPQ